MSVLIKGMKMPNTCQICRAARLDRLIDCEEFDRLSIAQRMYKRSETCPLVEVPLHGRLIDADAMIASIKRQTSFLKIMGGDLATIAEVLEKGILQEIENAQTIIEAEEGET